MHDDRKPTCSWPACDRPARSRHLCARDYKRARKVGLPPGWPKSDGDPPSVELVRRLVTDYHRRPGGAAGPAKREDPPPPVQLHVAPPLPPLPDDDPLAAPAGPPPERPAQSSRRRGKREPPPRRKVTIPEDDPRLQWLYEQLEDVRAARDAATVGLSHTAVSQLFKEERALRDQIDRERRRLEDLATEADPGDLADLPLEVYLAKLEEHAMTLDVEAQEVYVRVWLGAMGMTLRNVAGELRIERVSA